MKLNILHFQVIHDGYTCKEYQDRLQHDRETKEKARLTKGYLDDMLQRNEAMKCPKCGVSWFFVFSNRCLEILSYTQVIITKQSGCDGMICLICRTEICWATRGRRWGPAGRGDTSGGCRCGVNGRRCHPNCGNCH